jgi:hypothetical protein
MWIKHREEKEKAELMQDPQFELIYKKLTKSFDEEPSLRDIKWGLYNYRLNEYKFNRLWGLYRNTLYEMALLLETENELHNALYYFLELAYIDINGPQNIAQGLDDNDFKLLKEEDFIPNKDEDPCFSKAITVSINNIVEKLNISEAELKEMFLSIGERATPSENMPIFKKEAWKKLKVYIYNK